MISFIGNIHNRQTHRDRKQISDWQGLIQGVTANGYRVSMCDDEKVLELDHGDSCTTPWMF